MRIFFTDNGPDYRCLKCGADTSGEIGHECDEWVLDRADDEKIELGLECE